MTVGTGTYGAGVRSQVLEVIIGLSLIGKPWKEICAKAMEVNAITENEIEQEIEIRCSMPCEKTFACLCSACCKRRTEDMERRRTLPCQKTSNCECMFCITWERRKEEWTKQHAG